MINRVVTTIARHLLTPQQKQRLKRGDLVPLYDTRDWQRVVMYEKCDAFIDGLRPPRMDALEISPGHNFQKHAFRSFAKTDYPKFNICEDQLDREFDLIIADQVWEHLKWPYKAARNVYTMLRPGGWFVCTVPFMIRLHYAPIDCSRWSEDGLRYFLAECGWDLKCIQSGSWGNRAYIKAHMDGTWPRRGILGSLKNEPDWPVAVWAFAQRELLQQGIDNAGIGGVRASTSETNLGQDA